MPAIYLTEDDVRELMDMETSIELVEEAFRQMAGPEFKMEFGGFGGGGGFGKKKGQKKDIQ